MCVITLANIPKINEMLAYLHDSKYFMSLDLRSGYYLSSVVQKLDTRVLLQPYLASMNS